MAHCNANLCRKVGYCNMAAYCKKVHPKLREEFLKGSTASEIDVEIFKANGSGANCTKS